MIEQTRWLFCVKKKQKGFALTSNFWIKEKCSLFDFLVNSLWNANFLFFYTFLLSWIWNIATYPVHFLLPNRTVRSRHWISHNQNKKSTKIMKILRECKFILILLGISDEKCIKIGNQHIPRTFSRLFIIIALGLCVILTNIVAQQNIHRGISVILMPASLGITYFFQIVIYVSLLLKNRQTFELIDYLSCVVNKRNFFFNSCS